MDTTYIYTLEHPVNGQIKYVGKTNTPQKRAVNHACLSSTKGAYLKNWVISLSKEGLSPKLSVIDTVDIKEWQFWEKHYISLYKSWGFKLTNLTDGGNGFDGYVHSAETKKKMKESHADVRGSKNPMFGKKSAMRGKKHSHESKIKMSNAQSGEKNPAFGKHLSNEQKERLRVIKGIRIIVNDIEYPSVRKMCLELSVNRSNFKYLLLTKKVNIKTKLSYKSGAWASVI